MLHCRQIDCGLSGAQQRFVFSAYFVEEGEFASDAFDPVLCRSSEKYLGVFVLEREFCKRNVHTEL